MLFGIIFWFIDMRKNLTQKEKNVSAFIDSLYWSIGIMTTIGSEISPHKRLSNILLSIYSIISLFTVTILTGAFSILITLEVQQSNATFDIKEIPFITYTSYNKALTDLHNHRIQAILVQATTNTYLKHVASTRRDINISNISSITASYSYMVKKESPILLDINTIIIKNSFDNVSMKIKNHISLDQKIEILKNYSINQTI